MPQLPRGWQIHATFLPKGTVLCCSVLLIVLTLITLLSCINDGSAAVRQPVKSWQYCAGAGASGFENKKSFLAGGLASEESLGLRDPLASARHRGVASKLGALCLLPF